MWRIVARTILPDMVLTHTSCDENCRFSQDSSTLDMVLTLL